MARGKADTADSKPMTVTDALARYKIDLKSRGGHLSNATRVEKHLTGTLAGKPVALLPGRRGAMRSWRKWSHRVSTAPEPACARRWN